MHKRFFASAFATAATVVAIGALSVAPAMAQGGAGAGTGLPCQPAVTASGTGTLGTPWALRAMYDGNAAGAVVIGEEFEINTGVAGQVWALTFAVNGTAFFAADVTSTATGVREVQMTPYHGGPSHVTAHAVNEQTGEVIDGTVNLPAEPVCGH
jgi:hypothetical protein